MGNKTPNSPQNHPAHNMQTTYEPLCDNDIHGCDLTML